MMNLRITLSGLDDVERRAREAFGALADAAVMKGLYLESEEIMSTAKRLTPVSTGALRASGHVVPPKPGDRQVVLAYGGPAAPYAGVVHEDLTARHSVGQAKYLEAPLLAASNHVAERVAARIKLK